MAGLPTGAGFQQTTSYGVVVPFYAYGAVSLLIATILLLFNTGFAGEHHFNPNTLTITHLMALGWGTMVIFGASYQLLPVLISGKLNSELLGKISFLFMAVGIPFVLFGFHNFKFNWVLKSGAILVNIGVLLYLINVINSSRKSEKKEVHAWFVITAAVWLFSTTFFGLLLVYNFMDSSLLGANSLEFLTLHAHLGLVGWFLMLVFGVGSRLIPLFLISKYKDEKVLWWVYVLGNSALISFIVFRLSNFSQNFYYISILIGLSAVLLFGYYCRKAYLGRIRKQVDNQVKLSMISILVMLLPILTLIIVLAILPGSENNNLVILYGFTIFFGWITAIILGMTFKTLPFIVWNKVYQKGKRSKTSTPPAPKELFNEKIYDTMMIAYLAGFIIFVLGIIILNDIILKTGAVILLLTAALYVYNVSLIILHKSKI